MGGGGLRRNDSGTLSALRPCRLRRVTPSEPVPLAPPSASDWARIGGEAIEELHGGHQSRVFRVRQGAGEVVVKLTDRRHVDTEHFARRVDLVDTLAHRNPDVVGPIPLSDDLVSLVGDWLAVAYPYVSGEAPDIGRHRNVEAMGHTLATLHRSLAELPDYRLPSVSALRVDGAEGLDHAPEGRQLLHGDYSSSNLRMQDGRLRIFDFDDCGYGPVEFEIGNTLYMVLFDATMTGRSDRYERFRQWFVPAYGEKSGRPIAEPAIGEAINRRLSALRHWLDNLGEAPIGIRNSPPEWRQKLRAFARNDGRA